MNNINFFGSLVYFDNKIQNPELYLQKLLLHPEYLNANCFDLIDYEKLIAIEIQEKDNEIIQSLLTALKNIISENYFKK